MPLQSNITELDYQQVLRRVYDKENDLLRTNANITIDGSGGLDVVISDLNDSVAIGDGAGNLAGITDVNGENGLNVKVLDGEFSATGLKNSLKTTKMTITDVAQQVPNIPLINRNGISIRVLGANTVYFGNNTVTTNNGYPKLQWEEVILDIKDSIAIYAVCEAGKTCDIAVMEVS